MTHQIDNYHYFYQKAKNEPKGIIVFIHGFATTSSYHMPFVEQLEDYDYYAIELPGHGHTPISSINELSPYNLAIHVVKWIELLKLNNFYLIGHSMGGGISGMVANMIPEKIIKLIMVTPMNSSLSKKLFNVFKFNPKNNKETLKMQEMLFKDYKKFFTSENDPKIIEETNYQLQYKKNFSWLLTRMCGLPNHLHLKKAEKNLKLTILLILGIGDDIIDWESTSKLFTKRNNFSIMIFDNSGHLPFIEESKKYYKTIMNFIKN